MGVRTEWGEVESTHISLVSEHSDQYGQGITEGRVGLVVNTGEILLIEADNVEHVRSLAATILDACDRFETLHDTCPDDGLLCILCKTKGPAPAYGLGHEGEHIPPLWSR